MQVEVINIAEKKTEEEYSYACLGQLVFASEDELENELLDSFIMQVWEKISEDDLSVGYFFTGADKVTLWVNMENQEELEEFLRTNLSFIASGFALCNLNLEIKNN